jgi:hypothetical protein
MIYPGRNNAPLLPPGQLPARRVFQLGERPSLRGRSPYGAEPGPAAAAGLHFRIISVGFNALLEFLTGFIPPQFFR